MGKSLPDMYGMVIHANVLSMLLNGRYIKLISEKFTYLLVGLLVLMTTYFQVNHHKKNVHIAHWKKLLLLLGAIILIVYLLFVLFSYFHIKADPLPFIIAMVVCVEMFGPYQRLAERLMGKMTSTPGSKKNQHNK
jgi:CHASE2 domain-containing sensor protein